MTRHHTRLEFLKKGTAAGVLGASAGGFLCGDASPLAAQEGFSHSHLKITDIQVREVIGKNKGRSLYLWVKAGDEGEGLYGPIDREAALMVTNYIVRPALGENPLAHEAIWDKVFRASRHSRSAHYLIGLSALDNALWDLKGRLLGQPVYRLLGGNRDTVEVYGSCLGFPLEKEPLQAKARELKSQGYRHQKWFLRDSGPEKGPAGLDRHVQIVKNLREAVGDEVDLMFDAFWQWDLPYAAAWAKRAEPYHPRWIEEPFVTADLDAFIELSRETSIPVATGEHFYGRWDVQKFLSSDAIRVVQADPEWCGGVSELVKICALASVHGAHVIPHGHSLHAAMHVVASQPIRVCPLVEYLINKMEGSYYQFEKRRIHPKQGKITLPNQPGFGIELDEAKIAEIRAFPD